MLATLAVIVFAYLYVDSQKLEEVQLFFSSWSFWRYITTRNTIIININLNFT